MTAMIIMNIVARIVCVLTAIAFCGASVRKENDNFDTTVVYGALSAVCLLIAIIAEVK